MPPFKRLSNIIRAPLTLINSVDQGLRRGPPATQSKAAMSGENTVDKELSDLTDRRRISRTIENSREAMEIDPTTWSSVISLVMASNNWKGPNDGIVADDGADDAALEHIIQKCKINDWDLDSLMTEILIKGMVDSKCFIRLWPNQNDQRTLDVAMLAYDEDEYNFIELIDPETGQLAGYKQKATIYPLPEDWENTEFDELVEREGIIEETSFTPDQVIHPKYLDIDGEATSIVFKVLDYVDIKREIENQLPQAIRRAMLTLGVEIGGPDTEIQFSKESEAQRAVDNAADTFKEKEKKDVISHIYGVKPYMIGNNTIPDYQWVFNYLKQEIRQALFTPDSKFESASSNRAVAMEQLSGSYGLPVIINYNQGWIRRYIEYQLFARELILAGFESSVGMIHLRFPKADVEDDLQLSQIAATLESLYPAVSDEDRKLRLNTYFKPYTAAAGKQEVDISNPNYTPNTPTVPEVLRTPGAGGVIQNSLPWSEQVTRARKILKREGVLL